MWLSAGLSGRTHPEEVLDHVGAMSVTWEGSPESDELIHLMATLRRRGATTMRLRIHSPGDMPRLLPGPLGDHQLIAGVDLVAVSDSVSRAVLIPLAARDGLWPWCAAETESQPVAPVAQARRLHFEEIDQATQALTDLGAATPHPGVPEMLREVARLESSLVFPAVGDSGTFFRALRVWVIATVARSVLTPVPTSTALAQRDEVLAQVARVARRTMEASSAEDAR